MSEVKLKTLSHKERKDYLKKIREMNKLKDDETKYDALMEFREKFLIDHIEGEVDLDSMPATEVDDLIKKLEGGMDFHMGLRSLMKSNIPPSSEVQAIQKPGSPSKT